MNLAKPRVTFDFKYLISVNLGFLIIELVTVVVIFSKRVYGICVSHGIFYVLDLAQLLKQFVTGEKNPTMHTIIYGTLFYFILTYWHSSATVFVNEDN